MKTKRYGKLCCFLCSFAMAASSQSTPDPKDEKPPPQQYSAMAFFPRGAGRRMAATGVIANVNIYINGNSTDAETQQFAGTLIEGGSDALLKALKQAKPLGRISLVGRFGFYDLKLVRSTPTETGRRIIGVTDRPIGFLEAYSGGRSKDYKLGVLVLDLQAKEKGKEESEGALIYAAKIKITDGNDVEIENYGITPVRLMIVRRL